MVHNNKVLTVSYGTFSCTLEGFDDSFDTMKAIAEYFRDLAADDRYFGAEPPQPDAEMMAQIAQKETARRVNAHHSQDGIVLKAQTPALNAPTEQPLPAAPVAPAPEVMPEVAAAPALETPKVEVVEPDSIAAKLQRIREVVSRQDPAPNMAQAFEDEEDIFTPVEDVQEATPETTPALETAETAPQIEPEFEPESAPEITQEFDDEPLHEPLPEPAPQDETADDLPAPVELSEETAEKIAGLASLMEQANAPEQTEEPIQIEEAAQVEPATQAEPVAQVDPVEDFAPETPAVAEDDAETPDETEEALDLSLFATAPTETAKDNALFDDLDSELDSLEEPENILAAPLEEETLAVEAAPVDEPEPQETAKLDAPEPTAISVEDTVSSVLKGLSPTDEADLMRELADAESQARGITITPDELVPDENDADITRLVAEAESKMGDTDSSSRRETYTHLRAAVAATQAERDVSGDSDEQARARDAYRNDLASVVQPRRPVSARATQRPRPQTERAAPLKLVAEQRVDSDATPSGPVTPRRVSIDPSDNSLSADPQGFQDFAASIGAKDLPEQLEAAAAYMSFVEDRDQFSRPQLFTKVRQLRADTFRREDGLRVFGSLLREGKIERVGNGRFIASQDIRYIPDDRRAV